MVAARLGRRHRADRTVDLDRRDLLRFAAVAGAQAAAISDRIGTLRPGRPADLTLVEVAAPSWAA
ncbi:amidohydrolase family protein [Micromonospora azadirachtae]|uniref:Amidohydrolase family protein n=1 Tax=Micromonospora azadirachtae TaxID=1970735 RepID=A0ABW3A3T5_9ACTN